MKCFCLGLVLSTITTGALAQTCIVADPTGTPLNVRTAPGGAILGALHNGVAVRITDKTYDESGKSWVYIVPLEGGKAGWVFRAYLDCS